MPLPLILAIGAAIAGAGGLGAGVFGAIEMDKANNTMRSADIQHKKNVERFEEQSKVTSAVMDKLGKLELEIIGSFDKFTEVFDKIHGKPQFASISIGDNCIPVYNPEEIKKASVGAGVLIGGLGGAALGTAGGFAAAGATTAAVMALGTASTGTAIASLSGAAATNATLAAIGGGALAAGGGGIALGTVILGAATFGIGLLVGGVIFNLTGTALSNKAEEAEEQMKKAEKEINKICAYLKKLYNYAIEYEKSLSRVKQIYDSHLTMLSNTVNVLKKTKWNEFSEEEKIFTENTAMLTSLLFNMCKVQIVKHSGDATKANRLNKMAIDKAMSDADSFLIERGLAASEI